MFKYLLKRILIAIPIFIGITAIVYTLSCLAPGNVVDVLASQNNMTKEAYEAAVIKYGLDQPIIVRYLHWLVNLLHGDFGISTRTQMPIWTMISERLPSSLLLTATSLIVSVLISVPLGVMAAYKPYSAWDNVSSAVSFFGASAPNFFISLIAVYFFAAKLNWLPAQGMYTTGGDKGLLDLIRHMILPVLVLCIQMMGSFIKQTRGSVMEVMNEEYIKTARQKGITEARVVVFHALRNAWIPIVTTIGLNIPFLVGGAVVTEQIFAWPGIGSLMITAINTRDYDLIMGVTVLIAIVVLAANILMDLIYAWLDPRIGYGK